MEDLRAGCGCLYKDDGKTLEPCRRHFNELFPPGSLSIAGPKEKDKE